MNKKLEELFDMPDSDPQDTVEEQPISKELVSGETLAAIEKVESALPQVRGLESSDTEMDEIADLAKEAFNNLMDLGMQTDPRFSAEIFSVGSSMLGHALTAKTAKMQKKLKMIDLQLKQADLERKLAATKEKEPDETPLGTGQVVDRNMLIKMILNNEAAKNDQKDK
jgi:hypothetical protein